MAEKIEGVKKGFITIDGNLVENDEGDFYIFEDADALKAFVKTFEKDE